MINLLPKVFVLQLVGIVLAFFYIRFLQKPPSTPEKEPMVDPVQPPVAPVAPAAPAAPVNPAAPINPADPASMDPTATVS